MGVTGMESTLSPSPLHVYKHCVYRQAGWMTEMLCCWQRRRAGSGALRAGMRILVKLFDLVLPGQKANETPLTSLLLHYAEC